ncbi:hypothetical protein VE25_07465 [Devosia geojensis]|uniref:Uncharacterized protein n=1 Tax=Devosia geojensis TaxID=443610 RepID=A0A0F5FU29_9HYPH|nr:hypothetical protein [Devosia geojensis]KKB12381.1 hypothetical protein VE25_07465 [Devosia geojensis]
MSQFAKDHLPMNFHNATAPAASTPTLLAKLQRRSDSRQKRTVHIIMVLFKFDTEHCQKEIGAIRHRLNGLRYKAAMQTRYAHAFVVQTHLTADELMDQVRPVVSTDCVPSIERAWCFTPGADIAASEVLDPLTDYVREAWEEVRRWNDPARHRKPSPTQIFERKAIKPEDRHSTIRSRLLGKEA